MSQNNPIRNYKDTVFSSLFYDCDNAVENAKDLYYVLTGKTVEKAEKCRLDDVLFREFKNDVAYIMDGKFICFIEHQSTLNPNMPLRCLIYASRTYERKAISNDKLLYSSNQINIPAPEFYILYNGEKKLNYHSLKLSDSFIIQNDTPSLELCVNVVDINFSKIQNTPLSNCQSLYGYAYLIAKIRQYHGKMQQAINECISHNILKDYLEFYGSEVVNMLYTEYDSAKALEIWGQEEFERGEAKGRAEGKAEGRAEGKAEGRVEGKAEGEANMIKRLQNLGHTITQIAAIFEMPESEIEKLLAVN